MKSPAKPIVGDMAQRMKYGAQEARSLICRCLAVHVRPTAPNRNTLDLVHQEKNQALEQLQANFQFVRPTRPIPREF